MWSFIFALVILPALCTGELDSNKKKVFGNKRNFHVCLFTGRATNPEDAELSFKVPKEESRKKHNSDHNSTLLSQPTDMFVAIRCYLSDYLKGSRFTKLPKFSDRVMLTSTEVGKIMAIKRK